MNQKFKTLFLEQTYQDVIQYFSDSINEKKYESWDFVVLTASNEMQAQNYRNQICDRLQKKLIDERPKYLVVADFNGERIGSGGATLSVLSGLKNTYGVDFSKAKILLIHSGGDSKRIPQYSAPGKLFSAIPRKINNRFGATLFDELLAITSLIPSRMTDGVMVMSGDVETVFNPLQVDFKMGGAVAISVKKEVAIGKNHGVFLTDEQGDVLEFLHKKSEQELRQKGAVDGEGNVNIDTGIILFDGKIAKSLLSMVEGNDGKTDEALFKNYINQRARLSFYGDFLYPLAKQATLEDYLRQEAEGEVCDQLLSARELLWKNLQGYQLKMILVSPAEFIHFGTTSEFHQLMLQCQHIYPCFGWTNHTISTQMDANATTYQSMLKQTTLANNVLVENCLLQEVAVGENTILSGCKLQNGIVPSNVVISCLKLSDGTFVARIYHENDDPKSNLFSTAVGKLLQNALTKCALDNTLASWEGEALWDAKIYVPCGGHQDAVQQAIQFYIALQNADKKYLEQYILMPKTSLKESFNHADTQWLIDWQNEVLKQIKIEKALAILKNKGKFLEFQEVLQDENIAEFIQILQTKVQNPSEKMRLYHFSANMAEDTAQVKTYETIAFQQIENICAEQKLEKIQRPLISQKIEVKMPARVNFGGGWSDTPPYCFEHGGTVLNAAISIFDMLPITVICQKIPQNKFVLESADADVVEEFVAAEDILNCYNPFDSVALQKAAIVAMQIVTKEDDIHNVFATLGGGLRLSTRVENIPRGSGLGTSSILAAACITALYKVMNVPYTTEMVVERVLCMEQLMSTGGGWQDQVGGFLPGIKLISSKAGVQNLKVQKLELSAATKAEFERRFALIYTGQRRLARNLLRDIVGKYIDGNESSIQILQQIQYLALMQANELEKGNLDAFADLLNQHWELSKKLDAGATNTCIDYIFTCVQDLICGKMICGAGGGGFLQVILKPNVTLQQLDARIKSSFGESSVMVWSSKLLLD